MSTGVRRLELRVEGRVQGVGFRATACALAHGFPVTGFVRNRYDGGVDVVVEGTEADILAYWTALRQSRLSRYIRAEHPLWCAPVGLIGEFSIRYD